MNIVAATILATLMLTNGWDALQTWEIPQPPEVAVQVETVPIAEPCVGGMTVTIDWSVGSPLLVSREGVLDGSIRADVVGTFLWVEFDNFDGGSGGYGDVSSVELFPDVTKVEICRP